MFLQNTKTYDHCDALSLKQQFLQHRQHSASSRGSRRTTTTTELRFNLRSRKKPAPRENYDNSIAVITVGDATAVAGTLLSGPIRLLDGLLVDGKLVAYSTETSGHRKLKIPR